MKTNAATEPQTQPESQDPIETTQEEQRLLEKLKARAQAAHDGIAKTGFLVF